MAKTKKTAELSPTHTRLAKLKPGALADLLYKTREERYALNKLVEAKKEIEVAATEILRAEALRQDGSGVAGKIAKVIFEPKYFGVLEDDAAFFKYVARTKQFDLLQRRLSNDAIKERWEAGKTIPGVKRESVWTPSITKL